MFKKTILGVLMAGVSLSYATDSPTLQHVPAGNISSWSTILNSNSDALTTYLASSPGGTSALVQQVQASCSSSSCDAAASGINLSDALDAIRDSGLASQPWVVKLGPGSYSLTSLDLSGLTNIAFEGSGVGITQLTVSNVITLSGAVSVLISNLSLEGNISMLAGANSLSLVNISQLPTNLTDSLVSTGAGTKTLVIRNSILDGRSLSGSASVISLGIGPLLSSRIQDNYLLGRLPTGTDSCNSLAVGTAINSNPSASLAGLVIADNTIQGAIAYSGSVDTAAISYNNPGRVFVGDDTISVLSNEQTDALSANSFSYNNSGGGTAKEYCTANLSTRCTGGGSNPRYWGISYGCVSTGHLGVIYSPYCSGFRPSAAVNTDPGASPTADSLRSGRSTLGSNNLCVVQGNPPS